MRSLYFLNGANGSTVLKPKHLPDQCVLFDENAFLSLMAVKDFAKRYHWDGIPHSVGFFMINVRVVPGIKQQKLFFF